MATPAYASDLTSHVILEEMPNTTGWTLISSGGGGASSQAAPETDDFIQGSNCTSRNPWSSSIRGMVYNSSQTITSGCALFIWWKADVAQTLAAEASGGVQILIGNLSTALKCYYVAGNDTYLIGGWRCAVIDPTTTPSTNLGSPDGTTSYFGVRWNLPSTGPSKGNPFKIDAFRWGSYATVTAGEAADPATWTKLANYTDATARRWGVATPTDTGAQVQGIVNWGSAGASVYSRDSSRSIVLLNTKGFTSTSFTQIVIQNASTDLEWDAISFLTLDTLNRGLVSVLNDAKAWLTNCSFQGLNTITAGGANTKFNGSVFRGCNAITAAGGYFVGCQVLAPTVGSNTSGFVWNVATDPYGYMDSMTFTKGANAHHAIEFGTSAPNSIRLVKVTFSGFNASDSQNDSAIHVKATGGTVTIYNMGCTGTLSVKSEGATVVISSDPVTVSLAAVTSDGTAVGSAQVFVKAKDDTGPFPYKESVTITNSSTTATVAHTGHGMASADKVFIEGASLDANNGVFSITVTGANEYTYTMGSSPGSNPSGTITSTYVALFGTTDVSTGVISTSRVFPSDQPVTGNVRKATGSPHYKPAPVTGTIKAASGATLSAVLILDD